MMQLELKQKWAYVLERVKAQIKMKSPKIFSKGYPRSQPDLPQKLHPNVLEIHLQALSNYTPQVYPGRVTLFQAREKYPKFAHDPQLGWAELVGGGLETYEVTGPHEAIMQEPHVQLLAAKLRACLSDQITEKVLRTE